MVRALALAAAFGAGASALVLRSSKSGAHVTHDPAVEKKILDELKAGPPPVPAPAPAADPLAGMHDAVKDMPYNPEDEQYTTFKNRCFNFVNDVVERANYDPNRLEVMLPTCHWPQDQCDFLTNELKMRMGTPGALPSQEFEVEKAPEQPKVAPVKVGVPFQPGQEVPKEADNKEFEHTPFGPAPAVAAAPASVAHAPAVAAAPAPPALIPQPAAAPALFAATIPQVSDVAAPVTPATPVATRRTGAANPNSALGQAMAARAASSNSNFVASGAKPVPFFTEAFRTASNPGQKPIIFSAKLKQASGVNNLLTHEEKPESLWSWCDLMYNMVRENKMRAVMAGLQTDYQEPALKGMEKMVKHMD